MAQRKMTATQIMEKVKAFETKANVSAAIILGKEGQHIGTVRIFYPKDGAGRLHALLADWTLPYPSKDDDWANFTKWQYGWANGYGYDKTSAALSGMTLAGVVLKDDGQRWDHQLTEAGFNVIFAV